MLPFEIYRKKEQRYDSKAQTVGCGFSGAVISDVGCMRKRNEDNFAFEKNMNRDSVDRCQIDVSYSGFSKQWHVACVFDGMGGGEMGDAASKHTAEIFLNNVDGEKFLFGKYSRNVI